MDGRQRRRLARRGAAVAALTAAGLALAACTTSAGVSSRPSTGAASIEATIAPRSSVGASGDASQGSSGPTSMPPGSADASGSGESSAPATSGLSSTSTITGPAEPMLPRGGRRLFPRYRLVGYCGAPGSTALGQLGIGDLNTEADAIEKRAAAYADGRTPLPVLELIATVVQGSPGPDGMYRVRADDSTISRYLAVARSHKALLLLDIQPGRSPFIDEVKAYAKWLHQPDVGIALDPEWSLGPGQVPMRQFGHTTGQVIDGVAAYLSGIVKANDLPQKALVYHQLTPYIVGDPTAIHPYPGVAIVQSVDGIGSPADKRQTWHNVLRDRPRGVYTGFKLFFHEDVQRSGVLMTPGQVLRLRPVPDYVMYE